MATPLALPPLWLRTTRVRTHGPRHLQRSRSLFRAPSVGRGYKNLRICVAGSPLFVAAPVMTAEHCQKSARAIEKSLVGVLALGLWKQSNKTKNIVGRMSMD